MNVAQVIAIGREAMVLVLMVSGPLLLAGLLVGLAVGIFQAVTQISEMTLTFIPKILSIIGLMMFMLPWMIIQLVDFTIRLYSTIPTILN